MEGFELSHNRIPDTQADRNQKSISKTTFFQLKHTMNGVEILCNFFMGYPKILKNG